MPPGYKVSIDSTSNTYTQHQWTNTSIMHVLCYRTFWKSSASFWQPLAWLHTALRLCSTSSHCGYVAEEWTLNSEVYDAEVTEVVFSNFPPTCTKETSRKKKCHIARPLASSPGHSCIFLHGCKTKSGSGMGRTRLLHILVQWESNQATVGANLGLNG